jgi:dipicolinate synthase subunit A
MKEVSIYPIGITGSCRYASLFLKQSGITLTDHISPEITHLLLDVPSFDEFGNLRDGSSLQELLTMLPESITIIGGKLKNPVLTGYPKIDLLNDSLFLAKNAAITAECALKVALTHLQTTISDSPTLILGWGRIGKCLSQLLRAMHCDVTVAARSKDDRSLLSALGYHTLDYADIPQALSNFRLLFNTVPQQTVPENVLDRCNTCIKIDLASYPGMMCNNMITARGLPGKYAPESTGKLIAESVLNAFKEVNL